MRAFPRSRLLLRISAFLLVAMAASVASASIHLIQLKQMIAGVHGDATAQAVAMRMRSNFQNQTQGARLVAWDAAGANPVILVAPGTSVPNNSQGDYILYTTTAFDPLTTPPTIPDFTMDPIPEAYLAAGSLTFETSTGSVYWRLSWGGGGYTGLHSGTTFNDADGDFGPAFAGAAPSGSTAALFFNGGATAMSVSNATDYTLTAEQPTFTNNAGVGYLLDTAVGVGDRTPSAGIAVLHPAFPNPFNPSVNLPFELERAADIRLTILDARGRLVRVLTDGPWPSGRHQLHWSGVDAAGRPVAGGVYHLRLSSEAGQELQKVVLVK